MFNFVKNVFNKFFDYLVRNSSESFNKIDSTNNEEEFECDKKVIDIRDILKKKKTKVDTDGDESDYKDKNKEKKKSCKTNLNIKKGKISYVEFIKKQKTINILKKVVKSVTVKLFPKKCKTVSDDMITYKLNMIATKMKIFKYLEKRCNALSLSKSVVYLDEGMGTFLSKVKRNIKSNQRNF